MLPSTAERLSASRVWATTGKASTIMSKEAEYGRVEAQIVDAEILVANQRALIERMKGSGHSTAGEEFALEQKMNALRRLRRARLLLQHAPEPGQR